MTQTLWTVSGVGAYLLIVISVLFAGELGRRTGLFWCKHIKSGPSLRRQFKLDMEEYERQTRRMSRADIRLYGIRRPPKRSGDDAYYHSRDKRFVLWNALLWPYPLLVVLPYRGVRGVCRAVNRAFNGFVGVCVVLVQKKTGEK